jgi:hypothetical protein
MADPRRVTAAELEQRLGEDGLEALADITRQVTERVGATVLRWKVSWGVEDMIGLIVIHTCIVVSRQLGIGEMLRAERSAQEPTA